VNVCINLKYLQQTGMFALQVVVIKYNNVHIQMFYRS